MVMFSDYPADPRPRRAIDALVEQGMKVDLICLGENSRFEHASSGDVEVLRLPISHRRGGKFLYVYNYVAFLFLSGCILAARCLWRRYHIVYVHNMPDILVFSALMPRLLGAKVILDMHDPMPELMITIYGLRKESVSVKVLTWLERWSLAMANAVVTPNIATKRIFGSRSCNPEKLTVVMNSPDEDAFPFRTAHSIQTDGHGNRPFVMMYHGSLVERNGLDLALEALDQVRHSIPQAELRIYGRKTPFLEQVLADAQKKGLAHRFHYLGPRSQEELALEIENCDVGVIPNQLNPFTEINTPTRIFEYLAVGKPVIAPSTPGIQDYFSAESLLFFEAGNSRDLARQIEYAYFHPTEAMSVAQKGQKVYRNHTWREEKQNLTNLVSRLLLGVRGAKS